MKRLLCAALAALLLAGCANQAETAETAAVDTTAAIAAETTAPVGGISLADLDVPEKYTGDWSGVEGLVTVHADAKITLPDVNEIVTASVQSRTFTNQEAEAIITYMLDGGEFCENRSVLLKAEVQQQIERWQTIEREYTPDSTACDGLTGDEEQDLKMIREEIAKYEQLLSKAPEEVPFTQAKRTFSASGTGTVQGWGERNGKRVDILLYGDSAYAGFADYGDSNGLTYWYDLDEGETPEKCTISCQEAIALGDNMMVALGLSDAVCVQTTGIMLTEEEYDEAIGAYPDRAGGYRLQYTRQVQGLPLSYLPGKGGASEDGECSWDYERITLVVTDEGVIRFCWDNPYTVPQVEEQAEKLISFDEAAAIFERMIFVENNNLTDLNTRNQMTSRRNYDIDEVSLGYMRIRQRNNDSTGTLTPVWLFWGTETGATDENVVEGIGPFTGERTAQFAVNALNGSVVDTNLGY